MIAAIVVVGLVACVIVVAVVLLLRSRRNSPRPQQTAAAAAEIPVYSTSFSVSNNNASDSSGFRASRNVDEVGDDDVENTYEETVDTNY